MNNSATLIHIFGTVTGPADPARAFNSLIPVHKIASIDLTSDGGAVVFIDRGEDCAYLQVDLDRACWRLLGREFCFRDAEDLITISDPPMSLDPAEIAAIAEDGRIFIKGGGAPINISEEAAYYALNDWIASLGGVS